MSDPLMSEPDRKPLTGGAAYRRLLGYVRGYRRYFALAVVGMLVYSFAEMQMARFVQLLVDEAFIQENPETIRQIPLILMLIILGRAGGMLVSTYFMSCVSRGVIKGLRSDMFSKLLNLPLAFYDKSSTGEVIATFSYNVEQVAEATASVITTLVQDTLLVIFLIGYMVYTNASLSLVLFVLVPVAGLIVYSISFRFRKVSRRIQQSIGRVTHIVNETVDGHQVVKIFGGEDKENESFEEANRHNYRQNMKLALTKALSVTVIQLSAGLALGAVIYLSTSGWVGEVKAGVFAAFIVAMVRMAPPLKHLTNINVQLQKGIAAAISIFDLLDEAPERDTGRRRLKRAEGHVEYRDVTFAYDKGKSAVLEEVSFEVRPGETVALVGRSGSGKSTLVKLLPRFYDVERGEVRLDGRSVRDYPLRDLRNQIAFVGQNVTLFNDTVANNIAYGALEHATREQIEAAAEAANAMTFIERLPEGLDTMVGEDGVLLSGGQRQRLAIARALLKDAPILVLDEATSALDSESEQVIQAALEKLVRNRTTIVIAHRLSTVENADRIVVLDKGRVAEAGSHAELLKRDEQYASLYKLQFNLGTEPEPEPVKTGAAPAAAAEYYPPAGQDFLADEPQATVWERLWYGYHPLAQLFAPLGYLFNLLVSLRRWLYRRGVFQSRRFPVPVVVVGNVTVGGTGKTPLVIWLANHLRAKGYRPGIVSRGYKGKSRHWPLTVTADTDPVLSGDEAALIVRRTGCPMVVGPDRGRDVEMLLDAYDCNIVISDDGLQHYALGRDIEIIVADGTRGFGNGMLLPAGPMREPKSRLKDADYIVTNGASLSGAYPMRVLGRKLLNLADATEHSLEDWAGQKVHAVAAIGNPERFFDLLREYGVQVFEHRFEDHHAFRPKDLKFEDEWPVLMTEKDAVKCARLARKLDLRRYWYVPVDARLSKEFIARLDRHIEELSREQKAA